MSINTNDVNPRSLGQRGRPALEPDRIVGAALELVDERGAEALSMRSLAQHLESGTATLYRHFANRAELVAKVVDRMLGEVDLDDFSMAGLTWQQACILFAQKRFDVLCRHGHVAPLLIGDIPMGANAMAHREFMFTVLLDNGFSPVTAAHVYATLSRYVLGFAIQVSGSATTGDRDGELSAAFQRLDPSRYPATVAVSEALPVDLSEEFVFGLRLIVVGLENRSWD